MSLAKDQVDYSIVICTYNPEERLLRRCLNAVYHLDKEGMQVEVMIVDNNSAVPVDSLAYVKEYAEKIPALRLLREPQQGLQHARIAAITAARGKHIVYFDDDNEPAPDYLQELKKLHAQYPQVGAWGPGQVTVEFMDGIAPALENYARPVLQERHDTAVAFAAEKVWQSCYPYGTGLCAPVSLQQAYVELTRQGRLTLSGRKGGRLNSGDDTQIVLLCISQGYAAGISPALKIRHLIPERRSREAYLRRLIYGTSVCYHTCVLQVFPAYKAALEQMALPPAKFARKVLKRYLRAWWSADRTRLLDLVQYTGAQAGVYTALERPLPGLVSRVLKHLKVD